MLETAGDLPLAALPCLAARMDTLIAAGHGTEDLAVIGKDAVQIRPADTANWTTRSLGSQYFKN